MSWRMNEKVVQALIGDGPYLPSMYVVEGEYIEQAGRAWLLPDDPVLREVLKAFSNYNIRSTASVEAIARGLVERMDED